VPPALSDRIAFDGAPPLEGQLATPTPQAGLNGSTISLMPGGPTAPLSVLDDWDRIAAYVRAIRAPSAPRNLDTAAVSAGRALFQENNCAGCHGSDMWTLSRVFYTPSEENNNALTGALRETTYTADAAFPLSLNPASAGADRKAPLRFVGKDAADNAANDQINCVLRAVGTFPGVPDATGFNPPALLGMASGAPYFHAGNARTLEELFAPTFAAHQTAFSSNFPGAGDRAARIGQLVQFLLSIDETTEAVEPPDGLGFDPVLCPSQFPLTDAGKYGPAVRAAELTRSESRSDFDDLVDGLAGGRVNLHTAARVDLNVGRGGRLLGAAERSAHAVGQLHHGAALATLGATRGLCTKRRGPGRCRHQHAESQGPCSDAKLCGGHRSLPLARAAELFSRLRWLSLRPGWLAISAHRTILTNIGNESRF
jgi:hypothetical protein